MFSVLTLKAKLILIAVFVAIIAAAGLYINHLHGTINEANKVNGQLTAKLESANEKIKTLSGELQSAQREIVLVKKLNTEADDVIKQQKLEYATLMGKYRELFNRAPKTLPSSLVAMETPQEKENSLIRINLLWESHCLFFPNNAVCSHQEKKP